MRLTESIQRQRDIQLLFRTRQDLLYGQKQNRETDCNADKMFKSQTVISGHFSCKHCGHLSEPDIYKELSSAGQYLEWRPVQCACWRSSSIITLWTVIFHNKPQNKTNSVQFFVQSIDISRIVNCQNKMHYLNCHARTRIQTLILNCYIPRWQKQHKFSFTIILYINSTIQ